MPPLSSTQTPEPISIQSRTRNSQVTPPGTQPNRAKKVKMEPEAEPDLAPVFKSDLTNLRSLVTCSICDQLLYEPFTIQCGHTYCYSCLCSWFVPNRRKKTCPECRTIIKQMPAPSFMIKQMVEVFVNRAELMPADESVEQHATKRAEEVAAVDVDRNGPNGLFKGLFPPGRQELILDEADGVHRCPHCNTEYTGGASCETCGAEIDDDDIHNFSGDDLDEMSDMEDYEEGLRQELENEFEDRQGGAFGHMARMHQLQFNHHHHVHHPNHHGDESSSITSGESREDVGDEDESLSESDDDEGSLRDFVEHDESPAIRNRRHATPPQYDNVVVEVTPHAEPPRRGQPIDISDDDSDEGGPVVSRGRRNRWSRQASTQPSVINLVEDDSSASDAGDMDSVAERLRYDGWSPLHEAEPDENESDHRVPASNDGSDDDSDTETIGNDDGGSPRRRFDRQDFTSRTGRRQEWSQESDADDDASEDGTNVDRDGDTEMSVSVSPDAHAARRHHYDEYPESEASQPETDYDFNGDYDLNSIGVDGIEQLGVGHNLQELDDDTSDGWPSDTAHRRRPRRVLVHNQEQEEGYNPRISRIFASHQDIMMREGSQRNPISLEDGDAVDRDVYDFQGLDFNHDHSVRQPANSSRTRRPARAYRMQEPRSQSAQRRTQSPSVARTISTSIRPARTPRLYVDRSRGASELRYQS